MYPKSTVFVAGGDFGNKAYKCCRFWGPEGSNFFFFFSASLQQEKHIEIA